MDVEDNESDHRQRLLAGLIELYRDQQLTDVTLKSGDASVMCHRNVLAASSSYFRYNLQYLFYLVFFMLLHQFQQENAA